MVLIAMMATVLRGVMDQYLCIQYGITGDYCKLNIFNAGIPRAQFACL